MDAIECIRTRTSTRRFTSEPVSKVLLQDIIDVAHRSPSYRNCQPWEVVVVSGKKKEVLSAILIHLAERGVVPNPDISAPQSWPEDIQRRLETAIKKRTEFSGIDMADPDYTKNNLIDNFRFYGAPHAIFLFQDSSLSNWQILDMGMFAQSLMLAAHSKGLGTVPQAYLTHYPSEVKKFLQVPDSKRLVLGLSIGYPNSKEIDNRDRSDRVPVSKIVKWIE
jgi:nitroreductase